MRYLFILLILGLSFTSCKSKQTASTSTKKTKRVTPKRTTTPVTSKIHTIIKHAESFKGTRYKYGGTNKKGMDCSGLVYVSYQKANISTPRTTRDLSKYGNWVDLKKVQIGDLLFFATKKNSRKVNHVGIVTATKNGIQFVHASTSKGVITSSLSERYWYFAFVQARRIM
jgi:cell wall-associated NlpC family hydrolase